METSHAKFMRRALALAEKGRGRVSPNPMVGCVLVKNGRIVGEGYHHRYGGPHAEIYALQKAGPKARGATAYVTLEPCSHWGKTPPCAPQLVNAGIKVVVAAQQDPDPRVRGKGFRQLKKGGIRVEVGLEREAAERLNQGFFMRIRSRRPYVVLKTAMTLDGKIATAAGASKWITGAPARRLVHQFRADSDAVLVGAETAVRDNPSLTSHGAGANPLRIVIDPRLRTPVNSKLFNDRKAPTLVITTPQSAANKREILQKKGVQILRKSLKYGSFDFRSLLKDISKVGVNQLLIEGGGETSWGLVKHGLVDEALVFVAPIVVGGRTAKTAVEGDGFSTLTAGLKLKFTSAQRIGEDLLIRGRRR